MTYRKMHADEVETDATLVRRLLEDQFPAWARLPIARFPSSGTDNALYRLGADLAARLPRIGWAVEQIQKESEWLPRLAPLLAPLLAPRLHLEIPQLLAVGKPAEGYPWPWAVYRWLPGEDATVARIADPCAAAVDLAEFLNVLRSIAREGNFASLEEHPRGRPLATKDERTRAAIAALADSIDAAAVAASWEESLAAEKWDGPPALFHGDLMRGNLLFRGGRLSAVIDFSCLGFGDPACDLMIAWGLFSGASRETFRAAVAVDDATWLRGRGHALSQALIFIPYYLKTNPVGVLSVPKNVEN